MGKEVGPGVPGACPNVMIFYGGLVLVIILIRVAFGALRRKPRPEPQRQTLSRIWLNERRGRDLNPRSA